VLATRADMTDGIDMSTPYGEKKTAIVHGRRMASVDEGSGSAIIFQHGNPTSSSLWRNVMPHLEGLGRLIACDLIGMGDSEKLTPSGPDRYTYEEQRKYLFALWDQLDIGDNVVFMVHDWGSALGFDWANQHRDRVAGIAYTEAFVAPLSWNDYIVPRRKDAFQRLRSSEGEQMILEDNFFVETHMPNGIIRKLAPEEMAEYVRPFSRPGEGRRPTLTWPRQVPIDGEPNRVVKIVQSYSDWLAHSQVPKLFINADPGALLTGRLRNFCRSWPNQTEITVPGYHFVPEDSPRQLGEALHEFVRKVRAV
jgi:haloalkane dehalogenase